MSVVSDAKLTLRRCKWATWGLAHQGTKDLRTSALVAVNDFIVNGKRLHLKGWVRLFSSAEAHYAVLVKRRDAVIGAFPVALRESGPAREYFGLDYEPYYEFRLTLDYVSAEQLDVCLCGEWDGQRKDTHLGVLKPNSVDAGSPTVFDPYVEGQLGSIELGAQCARDPWNPEVAIPADYHVDIVVPIFNGLKLLEDLVVNISSTSIAHDVYFVDDCSTDPAVPEFLENLCSEHTNYHLVRAEKNGGFVKTTNLGLRQTSSDVVLLNTDVQLPVNWLERLLRPLLLDEKVASATPFTNSGTICSFPNFLENNTLPFGMNVCEVDSAFSGISPIYNEVPTGVGFCMACSRKALDAVGYLDEEAYGRGYGEENDWCQSAIKLGFKNVMVENLFVFHNHGATFQSDEKQALIDAHLKTLSERFPNYNADVARYCEKNPVREIRSFAYAQLFLKSLSGEKTLYLTHDLGGGAATYLDRRVASDLAGGRVPVLLTYSIFDGTYHVQILSSEGTVQFTSECFEDVLVTVLPLVDKLVVNELASYPKLDRALNILVKAKASYGVEYEVLIHDYLMICPCVNLIDGDGVYCGMPTKFIECNECYRKQQLNIVFDEDIDRYRRSWVELLKLSNEVVVFSGSSRELLERAFGALDNIVVRPHSVPELATCYERHDDGGAEIVIGIIGCLTDHKGAKIIESLLKEADKRKSNVRFVLIGKSDTDAELETSRFRELGEYQLNELPSRAAESGAEVFFFPSVWPETFSYVCSEVIQMGYPLATFDLGAQAEKAASYELGRTFSLNLDSTELLDALMGFALEMRRRPLAG